MNESSVSQPRGESDGAVQNNSNQLNVSDDFHDAAEGGSNAELIESSSSDEDSPLVDPNFTTRAKIHTNDKPKTRSDGSDDLVEGLLYCFIADEPTSYEQALKDKNCNQGVK